MTLRDLAGQLRKQIDSLEAQAMALLSSAYSLTHRAIEQMVTSFWRTVEARLKPLLSQIESRYLIFSHYADALTTATAERAAIQGGASAAKLANLKRSGVLPSQDIPAPPKTSLFAKWQQAASDKMTSLVAKAARANADLRDTLKEMKRASGGLLTRAFSVLRDTTMGSYRTAQIATYKQSKVPGWIWVSNLAGACASCIALHGTHHSADEVFASHPHCRCIAIPDEGIGIEPGKVWFDEQPAEEQAAALGSKAAQRAYEQGFVSLDDFIGRTSDGIYTRSLKQVLGGNLARQFYANQ